jgi:hypothetical protein
LPRTVLSTACGTRLKNQTKPQTLCTSTTYESHLPLRPSIQPSRPYDNVGKLQDWANRISTAERRINEDEIHEKLLNSLPSDSLWQTAKMFCLRQSLGLEESINLLSSNKTPVVLESAASTDHNNKDESRGRKEGKDNQGRGSNSKRKGRKDTVKEQSSQHDSR